MCDDDKVTPVASEDILKLSGGGTYSIVVLSESVFGIKLFSCLCLRLIGAISGDWHCAYVLLYGPRILEVPEGTSLKSPQAERVVEKMDTETTSNTQE